MNIIPLLPTKKVTAFLLAGALVIVAFWFAIDVFAILEDWPEAYVLAAFVLIIGAIVAWTVPESAWARLHPHISDEDGPDATPPLDH